LAPIAKLTDALNRVRTGDENRVSAPAVCGKAFFSIRNGKYSAALELLLSIEQEEGKFHSFPFIRLSAHIDGQHLIVILKMVCYAHLHIIKTTMDLVTIGQ
jgi:hypothetical protein